MRRRPNASASPPAGINMAAYTTVYALSTHESFAVDVSSKLWRSASKAANSIVVSSETKKTALQAIQKAFHGDGAWDVETESDGIEEF
jgi:hypothetical protein